jgi:hypothetical protein
MRVLAACAVAIVSCSKRVARQAAVRDSRFAAIGQPANQRRFGMDMNGIRASGFESLTIVRNEITGVGYAGVMLSESAEQDAPRRQTASTASARATSAHPH